MARTYASFVELVRAWSNKDSSVVDNTKIQEAMRYAADTCYRRLRVASLEQTVTYSKTQLDAATTSSNNRAASKTELTIPADLVEFIQLREIDDDGRTCRIFNEKTDLRTFNDAWAEKTQASYWTRVGNVILVAPGFGSGYTVFTPTKTELHYYKRLPALDALYDVTPTNFTAGYLTAVANDAASSTWLYNINSAVATKYATHAEAVTADSTKVTADTNNPSSGTTIAVDNASGTILADMLVSGTGVTLDANGKPPVVSASGLSQTSVTVNISQSLGNNVELTFSNTTATKYVGNEVAHWLRDENEKILLYGSLYEIFTFVQDDEQAQKYKGLFNEEILQLNDEDNKRSSSGGNIQINFNGRGMI